MFPAFSNQMLNITQLKIVTYNVHSFGGEITGFSAKEFADILNKEGVDVLCFQEYRGNGDFTTKDLYNTYSKNFPYSYLPEGRAHPQTHRQTSKPLNIIFGMFIYKKRRTA